ncbi:MAG TPA: alpha/beta fold hydrolase [Steroidobacteraceae bacterium]|nr:alpha/beta fold hydrolase [Steroidobacteraceae bacterium]
MVTARRALRSVPTDVRVRRAYFDCRYGQLHMHYAIPSGGGFDEATPLLCLAGHPGSGRFFVPLLASLGRDRSAYAPDLPACGESDPVDGHVTAADAAQALYDFLDSMHLRQVDLLAHEEGVAVALSMLELRPAHIGRMVLSPPSDALHAQVRSLRHATLLIDLGAGQNSARSGAPLEEQAAQLREFLGLP